MALGMLLVIVAGHIDLSVGPIVGFIGAVAAMMMAAMAYRIMCWRPLICLVFGGAIGAAQGYWIAYHRIPSFIVTLAGMLVFRGLTLSVMTAAGSGTSIGPFPPDFQLISTGFIPDVHQHRRTIHLDIAAAADHHRRSSLVLSRLARVAE